MENKRRIGLDAVRACAVLSVILVHFFLNTNFYVTPIQGKSMYLQVFLRMTFMMCVPLFLILTGYLQKDKQPTGSYFKKLIPVLIIYFVFSLLAVAFRVIVLKEHQSVLYWIGAVENFTANNYSWYIEMYIGLFFIAPFLNLVYNNLDSKKQKHLLLAVCILMTSCPPLFNGKVEYLIRVPVYFPNYWSIAYPVTYYFIGCYLSEYKPKPKKLYTAGVFFLTVLLETVLEIGMAKGGNFISFTGYFGSGTILVQSAAFFLLLYDLHLENKLAVKVISAVSILSLDIYLASNITDKIVYRIFSRYHVVAQDRILIYFLPIVFSTFLAAFMTALIRNRFIKVR